MEQVIIRQVGRSLYLRIPARLKRANDLRRFGIAYLTPIDGRMDKFELTFGEQISGEREAVAEAAE